MKKNKLWTAVIILAVIGIGLAAYLLHQYLKPDTSGVCNINARFNCLPTTKGELKDFLGIPVPVIGGVGYIVILLASIAKKKKLLLTMATFGMLFCLRITFLEVFVVGVICPVCLLCQLDMATVFVLSLMLLKDKEHKEETKEEAVSS